MAKRKTLVNRIASWWYNRGLRARARAAVAASRSRGMVSGRATKAAGLETQAGGLFSLIGRSYGSYRDVLEQIRHIRDYNPDAALAVWNTLRLANPGHQVHVYQQQPGPDGQPVEDKQGAAIIEEIAARVGSEYGGGVDTLIDVLNLTLMTQGAIAAELELSENVREVLDYCPVDPRWIDFAVDEKTGKAGPVVSSYGQVKWLNTNQFRYIPLDPDVDDPHGRSPMWTTLEIIFFQQEVLRDLKAVMHNQGYPRIDVALLEEIIVQNTPEHLKTAGREDEFRAWVDGYMSDVQTTYNGLNPDDTFIHWDWVKVGYVGATNGTGSVDVARVIQVIDTQMVAALKQLPILLGRNEGATTTHATVQWQIYVAGIEALQRRTKRMVEWLHNTALRVAGRQSYARVEFEPIRKSDRKAEAEAERIETETLVTRVLAGWMDNDEAATEAVGHEAVGPMMAGKAAPAGQAPVAAEQTDEKKRTEGEGSRAGLEQHLAENRETAVAGAPEGIPDWLWERVKDTAEGVDRWSEGAFAEKMGAYLRGGEQGRAEDSTQGGNGHKPSGASDR